MGVIQQCITIDVCMYRREDLVSRTGGARTDLVVMVVLMDVVAHASSAAGDGRYRW